MSAETDREEIGALRAEVERLQNEIPRQRAAAVRGTIDLAPGLGRRAKKWMAEYADRIEKVRWHG